MALDPHEKETPPDRNPNDTYPVPGPAEGQVVIRQKPPGARLTVVGSVYHRRQGSQPESLDIRFGRDLACDERPYVHELKVGSSWERLDTGWVEDPGYLVIVNQPPVFNDGQPTREVQQIASAAVVEVGFSCHSADCIIPRGETLIVHPVWKNPPNGIHLRCQVGAVKVVVYIFPK